MIYFARAVGTDFVKIGMSQDPSGRIAEMQTGCPHELVLERTIEGHRPLEILMHGLFKRHRVRGEWFVLTPAEIERLLARVDVSPLAEDR